VTEPLPSTPGGFRTLIADPPWPYEQALGRQDHGDKTRGGLPYKPMTVEEIASLPVIDAVADESMCFLWSTNAHLPVAFNVLWRWGFAYKTTLTWTKMSKNGTPRISLGYWFRGATEHCLFGVRGNPRSKLLGPNGATGLARSTAILAPRQKHSAKPPVLYEIAEEIGEAPRLEMFARSTRPGWTSWGNEVPDTLLDRMASGRVVA
jgi:N6-adenosine-specific RNA methylase IME4